MFIEYNPDLLHKLAGQLYRQALSVEVTQTLLGFLLGAGVAFSVLASMMRDVGLVEVMVGGLVGALLGLSLARPKAFALRVQAQSLLCQVQIEKNTARTAELTAAVQRVA